MPSPELHTHRAYAALRDIALAPIPPERWPDSHESSRTHESVIRMAAVAALADLAMRGNGAAEETLLARLAHEDGGTRQSAVMGYLGAGPDRTTRVATVKGRTSVIATIEAADVLRKILSHLGLATAPPVPAPARPPPSLPDLHPGIPA